MRLPVMDGANKAQKSSTYTYEVTNRVWKDKKKVADGKIDKKVESATMFDINTAIMRCLVKNLAMIGLGIYIYSGEDLPQEIIVKKTLSEEDILKLKDNVDSGKYTKTKEEFLKTLETSHDISEEQLAKISEIFKPKTATKADADKKAVEAKTEKAPSRKKGDLKELAKLDLPKITNTTIDAIKAGLKEGTYRQTADQCIIALRAKYTVSQIQETIIRKLFPSDENVEAVNEMDNLINNL
jgi:hypothetical protein